MQLVILLHMHPSQYIILKTVKEVLKTLVKLHITPFKFDWFSNQSSNFILYFFIIEVDKVLNWQEIKVK